METQTLRRETDGLTRLADRDLSALWALVARGASAEVALRDLLPSIITTYGALGATAAADWYDEQRQAAEITGHFRAVPLKATDRGAQPLVGWAISEAKDDDTLKALIVGGVQRRIANHVRLTITGSSVADPKARGWQRVGSGECDWCNVLIGRGAVYSKDTADFAAHDDCRCSSVPAWGGRPLPVKEYTASPRRSEADFDRAKRWMKENGYDRAN